MIEKIGIQTFTIRKDIKSLDDLENTFRYYSDVGIQQFELARINFSKEEMDLLRRLKKELGIEYSACQMTMSKINKKFDFIMEFCQQLGIQYLEVSVIPIKNFIQGIKGIEKLCTSLNVLGKKTAEHGISLLYHHHNFELIKLDDDISFDILLNRTDEKLVNFVCDTYWLAKSGYCPGEFIEKRMSRIKGIHLKDSVLKFKLGKFQTANAAIGYGTIDFSFIKKFDKYKLIDFYSIEQDTNTPQKDIKKSYHYLANILKD